MWLMIKNKILTKDKLSHKGWEGSLKLMSILRRGSTTNHLFLHCPLTQQVWFWMGLCQQHYKKWVIIKDIVEFSCTLGKDLQIAFLLVFSALSWTLWKIRDEMCFQHAKKQNILNNHINDKYFG